MAQKWPKNGLHHPMISLSHHPIITTSPHPIIASSHLGTPHMLWKWRTNTTSQKIFLGGQTISLRFLTPQRGSINMRFAAFFKIYQILKLQFLKFDKILCKFCDICNFFAEISWKLLFFQTDFLRKFWDCSGAKGCKSCRASKMLSNAYFLAKFRFDTAENEPAKNLKKIANNL